jgi:DNA-3-methyladenine glycosylase I
MKTELHRCGWCLKDQLYINYHDQEWGVPVRDDRKMFEFLLLETFQAGLSWYTILKKRDNFREAFFDFDPERIASMDQKYFDGLMENAGIIRNKAKIQGSIKNAKLYLDIVEKTGSFSDYIWKFTDGKPIVNKVKELAQIQPTSRESDTMSRELKKAGFAFVGSTVCYAHMQATGMVNDHLTSCFRYKELI